MRATKSPGALAAAGALEIDQLGSTVISIPIASLYRLQALGTVVARTNRCRLTAFAFDSTTAIVVSTRRPVLNLQPLSDLVRTARDHAMDPGKLAFVLQRHHASPTSRRRPVRFNSLTA
jgi:hypothetical protein